MLNKVAQFLLISGVMGICIMIPISIVLFGIGLVAGAMTHAWF